jgi:hypothetical protein
MLLHLLTAGNGTSRRKAIPLISRLLFGEQPTDRLARRGRSVEIDLGCVPQATWVANLLQRKLRHTPIPLTIVPWFDR